MRRATVSRSMRSGGGAAMRRAAFALILLAPVAVRGETGRIAIARLAAFALAATGVSIVSGMAGQISLGHAALMGAGAYTSAGFALHAGWPFAASFAAGVVVAVAAGIVLGAPAVRLGGQHLALATLGGGFIVVQIVRQDPWRFTGGDLGLGSIPAAPGSATGIAVLACAMLAAGLAFAGWMRESRAGRAYRAVRDHPGAAAACGVAVARAKLGAFLVSAAMAGAGGAIVAHADGFVSPGDYAPAASLLLVVAVVLGGMDSAYGGAAGVVALLAPTELAPGTFDWLPQVRMLVWGPVALLVVWRAPGGFAQLARALRDSREARSPEGRGAEGIGEPDWKEIEVARAPAGFPALEASGVTLRYGGVVALDGVDLRVEPGTIHALIGPNGSGKTSLLDVVCGYVRADGGSVRAGGAIARPGAPHRLAAAGVARTFQDVGIFASMSLPDNVRAGAHARGGVSPEGVHALLNAVGLRGVRRASAARLSFGQRKRLELARALASRPMLLLLDEPVAGRSEPEAAALARDLRTLRDRGATILLVEHHMDFVLSIADRVTVLDGGRVVAEGSAREVRADPRVAAAYLGPEPAR